jgi:hypothetical protein
MSKKFKKEQKRMSKPKISNMPVPSDDAFEERTDPRSFIKATEIEVGQSITALFNQIEEYDYKGKRCFNMILTTDKGKLFKTPIATKLRYIAALCIPEKTWVRITREEDAAKQGKKAPMKNFTYQTAGDVHTPEEVKAIVIENEWNVQRKGGPRKKKVS